MSNDVRDKWGHVMHISVPRRGEVELVLMGHWLLRILLLAIEHVLRLKITRSKGDTKDSPSSDTKSELSIMSFLEIILFAGWLLPVLFIGLSAIYVTTLLDRNKVVRDTDLSQNLASITDLAHKSSSPTLISQQAA